MKATRIKRKDTQYFIDRLRDVTLSSVQCTDEDVKVLRDLQISLDPWKESDLQTYFRKVGLLCTGIKADPPPLKGSSESLQQFLSFHGLKLPGTPVGAAFARACSVFTAVHDDLRVFCPDANKLSNCSKNYNFYPDLLWVSKVLSLFDETYILATRSWSWRDVTCAWELVTNLSAERVRVNRDGDVTHIPAKYKEGLGQILEWAAGCFAEESEDGVHVPSSSLLFVLTDVRHWVLVEVRDSKGDYFDICLSEHLSMDIHVLNLLCKVVRVRVQAIQSASSH